jgi:hypothetical protein
MDYQTAGDRIREVRAHMGARGWVESDILAIAACRRRRCHGNAS